MTGATGSFGQAFIKTILETAEPRRVVVFSRDELKQFDMRNEFDEFEKLGRLRFFIGDVRDGERLDMAFREIDYVVHAAALKQVTTAEYNPFECINTNVLGAENVARAAIRNGVKSVIALSTDKAANPINLYGASKLASDKIFIAANNLSGSVGTRFSVVRYGNVIGSRGSVVPFFQKMIREGADCLPITHEDMTRFWITLQQGVNLVLSSFASMQGGEIFVPKVPSMKVVDLANALAPNLPHKVIGIRPGEKLHEILVTSDDARNTMEFEDYYVIEPAFAFWSRDLERNTTMRAVPQGFSYASDSNNEWLDAEGLTNLLSETS